MASIIITPEQYPKTYEAFSEWFKREGWGADSIEDMGERGWKAWFPDFLDDYGVESAEQFEEKHKAKS